MVIAPRRSGFTLLEIVLVMAIILILGSVIYPSLKGMYGDTRVRGAADQVCAAWAEARARSIDSGTPYRFAVMPASEKYRIAPDSQSSWDGSGSSGSSNNSDNGQELTGALPKGIKFKLDSNATDSGSGWKTVATFMPDGSCKDDVKVTIEGDDCKPLIVSIRGLTGVVRVQTQKQANKQ